MNLSHKKIAFFSITLLCLTIGVLNFNHTSLADLKKHSSYQSHCPFCRIVAGQEGTILYQDKDIAVIEKNRPPRDGLKVDCLIVPKKHIRNLKTLDQTDLYDQKILSKMGFVAQMLGEKLSGDGGFRNEINNEFRQGVFHLHMHFKSPSGWKSDPSSWKKKSV